MRPHSALAAMGRWLDAQGKLPRPWLDGYTDMATMVELWDIALAEAVKAKGNVVQFWSGENEANAGFVANGATLGLCWDSTGYNLRNDGYGYMPPVEGAFAWHQGFVLMKNAVNVEQAHELAKWVSTAEGAAGWASAFSSNPVGKGAADLMNPDVAAYYNSAFNDDANWRNCGGGRINRPSSSPSAVNMPTSTRHPDQDRLAGTPGPNGPGVFHSRARRFGMCRGEASQSHCKGKSACIGCDKNQRQTRPRGRMRP